MAFAEQSAMLRGHPARSVDQAPSISERIVVILALLLGGNVFDTAVEMTGLPSALVTALWLTLYLYAIGVLFLRHGISWLIWLGFRAPLLTTILVIALVSVTWSIDPTLTLQRAIHLAGSSLVGFWFGYRFGPKYFFSTLTWAFSILVIGGALFALLLPDYGLGLYEGAYVWEGLESNKNAFGLTAAIAAAYFALGLLTGRMSRIFCLCMIVISLIVLINANSATSLVSLIAALVIGVLFYGVAWLRLHPLIAFVLLCVIGSIAWLVTTYMPADLITDLVGRSSSLTGRTDLWDAAWGLIEERPWLGYGYGSIWFPRPGSEAVQESLLRITWLAHHAHNSFLHVASELGIPAAAIAVALLPISLAHSVYLYARHASLFGLFGLVFIALFTVGNLTEVRIFVDRSMHWILFVAIVVALVRASERRPS